jgi:nucleotide-binding universal stress UspA family protein
MTEKPRVLAATDLSDSADEAILQAHEFAAATGADLAVCHVIPGEVYVHPLFPHFGRDESLRPQAVRDRAAEILAERVRQITGRAGDSFQTFVEEGSPQAVIVRRAESWGAERIFVGSHGATGLSRMHIGSVALNVVRHAHCAVLVARPRTGSGTILVGTDFSDPALPAVSTATDEARRTGARIILVHCLDPEPAWAESMEATIVGWSEFAEYRKRLTADADRRLADALARCGVEGEHRILMEHPRAGLVRFAEETGADLLVIGTTGRTGLSRVLLGSVAESVVRHAHCRVLVVRIHRP